MNAAELLVNSLIEDAVTYPTIMEIYMENSMRQKACTFCGGNCRHFVDKKFLDIFGQSLNIKEKDLLQCLNCARMISYKKYAAHLQTCLGLGRNSRTAKRMKATTHANPLTNSGNGVVQEGDVLWFSQGSQSSVNSGAFDTPAKSLFSARPNEKIVADPLQGIPGFEDDESGFGDSDLESHDNDDFDFVPTKEETSKKNTGRLQQSLSPALSEASSSSAMGISKLKSGDSGDAKLRKKRGRRKKNET